MVDGQGAETAVIATPHHVSGWRSHGGGHLAGRGLPNEGSTLAWATLLARSGAKTGRSTDLLTTVARFALRGHPVADRAEKVTEELVEDGTARAETDAWAPGDDRCYPFRDRIEDLQASCMPWGRCRVGWILANSGRDNWDFWLDLHSDTLLPRAATARPVSMSAHRKAGERSRRRAQDQGPDPAWYGAARSVRADEVDLESRHSRSGADRSAELL
jgi:hypothetical protein